MSKNTLTYEEKNKIISKYLANGKDSTFVALSKEYNVTTNTIKDEIDNPEVRLQIEKRNLTLSRAKDATRMDEIKGQMLEFISSSLEEGMDEPRKIVLLDKVKGMLDSLDRISRLNRGDITDNTQHTERKVNIDVAAIIGELNTPEKKKDFLRSQQLIIANSDKE